MPKLKIVTSKTFLGINLGVTDVRVILLDSEGQVLATAAVNLARSAPLPLWCEQSPEEWWHATREAITRVRADAPAGFRRLQGIGVSGQTQGTVLLDKHHHVLRPAILWSDSRARAECVELEALVTDSRCITGNIAQPSFMAPKLLWLQKYESNVFRSIEKVLMPKDYIVFRLTGEFVTDMSDASSTLCLNVARRNWSDRMIEAVGLTRNQFPRLAEGSDRIGLLRPGLASSWGLERLVSVAAGGGRPAATAVGLGAVQDGMAYISFGPSALVFVSTIDARPCPERAVRSFGHCLPNLWHQLGVVPTGMASLDWWATIHEAGSQEALLNRAEQADKSAAPLFLPYLNGASTPHDGPKASGVFFGLTENTSPGELTYAVMEGVAFSVADSVSAIEETGTSIRRASLVGEGSRNRFLAELTVTACGIPLDLYAPEFDACSVGAAHLARLATGECSASDLCITPPVIQTIVPRTEWHEELEVRHARFRRLYQALKSEFTIQEPLP